MDKELLRVVIIVTGLLVIMGMLAWHFFRKRNFSDGLSLFGNLGFNRKIDESLVIHNEHDDFDIVPKKTKRYAEAEPSNADDLFANFDFDEALAEDHDGGQEPPPRFTAPDIIQFCIMAKNEDGFNGHDLFRAFQIVGLEYGSLKIFERLDSNRLVDFGVACLVEPGTFPDTDLENFFSPGIVFFMQPAMLDDAVAVFDDFVDTIRLLVIELDGEALDHKRQPLTDETVELIRQSL